jgi:formylglycine-generating enzyme required for sulfatase activity
MTEEKRYQVFVSSTFEDLKKERQSAMEAVLKANCIPVGMERFPATPQQEKYIRDLIEQSDIYLLIIGSRCGSLKPPEKKVSYTEWEFDIAMERYREGKLYVFCEILENPQPSDETDEKREKLNVFRKKVRNQGMVQFWNDTDKHLDTNVLHSLVEFRDRLSRDYPEIVGWVRGDQLQGGNDLNDVKNQLTQERERREATEHKLAETEKAHKEIERELEEARRKSKGSGVEVLPYSLEFIQISGGEFMMGSPDDDEDASDWEKPQHKVIISQSFYLGKYPVTQKQWWTVMGNNPSYFSGDDNPVENVSWYDIQEFIKRLNEKKEGAGKYRLPTEAEWEYACRAGTTTKYSFGDDEKLLERYAWYDKNSEGKTHPVGGKAPNPWGLYDMHGNVDEWVADWYGEYPKGEATDPTGPESGSARAFRGGSWRLEAQNARSANRGWYVPVLRPALLGFRLAASVKNP